MEWARCEGRDEGHMIDSRVHRFDRDIGFLQAEDDQAMINEATAQAYARRRQQVENSGEVQGAPLYSGPLGDVRAVGD